ncbi:MAG: 50S ribosomal protein L14e [Candidatus Diapherotrites archaeon]|nr:50S ribosomal protein L14e [Candidatus Diapherotrites archaeon]
MPGMEVGTVCVKTRGREAGKRVVIVDFDAKSNFAVIDGPNIKRRKCNLRHLFPTNKKIGVNAKTNKKEIAELLK